MGPSETTEQAKEDSSSTFEFDLSETSKRKPQQKRSKWTRLKYKYNILLSYMHLADWPILYRYKFYDDWLHGQSRSQLFDRHTIGALERD